MPGTAQVGAPRKFTKASFQICRDTIMCENTQSDTMRFKNASSQLQTKSDSKNDFFSPGKSRTVPKRFFHSSVNRVAPKQNHGGPLCSQNALIPLKIKGGTPIEKTLDSGKVG